MVKYIVISGGVLSGIGKGVVASSTGAIMQALGFRVTCIKIDPYLNLDAGTMSPFEHGEVYVLNDGGEADLDLGNYERFLNVTLSRDNNITTGKIYHSVIEKERRGDYLGKTVQVVPHVIDEIVQWVQRVAARSVDESEDAPDLCIIELGGTIGDLESNPFIEAMRQLEFRVGSENFCNVHVSLVPVVGPVGEQKTKPTQASVRELRALGLRPRLVVCRSEAPLTDETRLKVSNFCQVPVDNVISVHNVSNLYRVPLLLHSQEYDKLVLQSLALLPHDQTAPLTKHVEFVSRTTLKPQRPLRGWQHLADLVDRIRANEDEEPVHIALVGKYTGLSDSYLSVIKALQHAALVVQRRLVIDWINSESLEPVADARPSDTGTRSLTQVAREMSSPLLSNLGNGATSATTEVATSEKRDEAWALLRAADGVLIPGGFGDRGIEGKVLACEYARKNNIPLLGICLGMQVAVIEYARNVLGWANANSEEFDAACSKKVVVFMPEVSKTHMGATMRLGLRSTIVKHRPSVATKVYGDVEKIDERHRHRYEVNPELVDEFESAGLLFSGQDETGTRMEIIELPEHRFYFGTQFHPEFLSRPLSPSPPFVGLLQAAAGQTVNPPSRSAAGTVGVE